MNKSEHLISLLEGNSVRISDTEKKIIDHELRSAGMDGNHRFSKPGQALAKVSEVIGGVGYEFSNAVNAHTFIPDKGYTNIDISQTNIEDLYSPIPVSNTMVAFSWTKLENGYEVIAYMS